MVLGGWALNRTWKVSTNREKIGEQSGLGVSMLALPEALQMEGPNSLARVLSLGQPGHPLRPMEGPWTLPTHPPNSLWPRRPWCSPGYSPDPHRWPLKETVST